MSNAATRATLPVAASINATLIELARTLGSMVEVTRPADRERLAHRLLLALILSVGALVRFWGLGAVGLHGDEDTMALAVMHILQDGRPILPSGLFYPRGFAELYLMAGSALIFGESEWAFRLPSALAGIALIVLAYIAGRRFLRPQWNLAFAATVALLPEIVVFSQTARMYIFMLAAVAAAMVCIFEWERRDRLGWLIGAVVALIIGIELHALAVTIAMLFLLPGLLQGDVRKLLQGSAAALAVLLAYLAIDGWVNAQYPIPPSDYAADIAPPGWRGSRTQSYPVEFEIALLLAGGVTAFFAIHLGRKIPHRGASLCAIGLLLAGLIAQLTLYYHVAALLFGAALVVGYRYSGRVLLRRSWMFALSAGALALIHVTVLAAQPGSVVKLVGAMVGQPSVWPYVRVTEFSLVATLLSFAATLWGLWRIATGRRCADFCLLALFGVWIPLFAIGFFVWNMPPRYASASVLPLLLSGFAFAQRGVDWLAQTSGSERMLHSWRAAAALLATALVINPMSASARINAGYASHPDHKGAADFMRTQQIQARDVVLAEDAQQQTYYLGNVVDYWLISRKHARRYVQQIDGEIREFYTGVRVIGSGEELARLLDRYRDRRIFVIGSGENHSDQRRGMRGFGIFELLASERFEVLYIGRDGLTKVWRARPAPKPAATTSPARNPGRPAGSVAALPTLAAGGSATSLE